MAICSDLAKVGESIEAISQLIPLSFIEYDFEETQDGYIVELMFGPGEEDLRGPAECTSDAASAN